MNTDINCTILIQMLLGFWVKINVLTNKFIDQTINEITKNRPEIL
jgi:hypothetical protein